MLLNLKSIFAITVFAFGVHVEAQTTNAEVPVPKFIQTLVPNGLLPSSSKHLAPNELHNPDLWMAVVSDSSLTGAASSSDIQPNAMSLLNLGLHYLANPEWQPQPPPSLADFQTPERFHITDVEPVTRVMYSRRERNEAYAEKSIVQQNLEGKGSMAVDIPEHSSAYMIGRALGMNGEDIVFVGQDGKRVKTIPAQLERIYEMQTKTLPPIVLLQYTANDFCNIDAINHPLAEIQFDFTKSLREAWQKSKPFLKAHPNGTKFIILPGLEVANVLTNASIAEQIVHFQGLGNIKCGRLREQENMNGFLSQRMLQGLGGMCDTVFSTKPTDTKSVQRIVDIQQSFSEIWQTQINELNQTYNSNGIEFIFVEGVRSLQFEKGDVANDCFHPGVRGHAKVADYILRTVFDK